MLYKRILLAITLSALAFVQMALQDALANPDKTLVSTAVIDEIKGAMYTDIVRMSIDNQNIKYGQMKETDILALDKKWRAETKAESQPLISATLSNPLSSYLTRIQAHSAGLYTEIFVMDQNGLNVGQSSISSDYWQGDEAKFQKTYSVGKDAVFIDDPEYNEDTRTWRSQVNLSIPDASGSTAIGAVTVEVNLTELSRRNNPDDTL